MVQQKEWRERPQLVEEEQKRPKREEFGPESRCLEQGGAEDEGSGGNENGSRDKKDAENERRCPQER